VGALTGAEAVGALVALLVVRLVSRQVAVSLAGRWSGVERPERRALAMAISTEGAMGLVVATVGMEHGLLSESMFAALVVLAVITTVVPPILLKGLVAAVPVSESERRRMAWESSDDEGFGSSLRRVLIPTRGGPNVQGVLALLSLVAAGAVGPGWPLKVSVFTLGVFNGAFSIAAIGSMMRLASDGPKAREGVRMGLWGAAQAVAFGGERQGILLLLLEPCVRPEVQRVLHSIGDLHEPVADARRRGEGQGQDQPAELGRAHPCSLRDGG
jgi:hypothetical protein